MSDPLKKFDQAPESYKPKAVPEILKLAGEANASPDITAPQAVSSAGGSGIIPLIRPLISDMAGQNYWFNGCAGYVMEALDEPDYDYWFFAGLTGDNFTQFYPRKDNSCAASDYLMGPEYAVWAFDQVGYACEYVTEQRLLANRAHYLQKIMDSIDRGVPVITVDWGVFVGYESNGQTLLYLTHERTEPKRLQVGGEHFIVEPIPDDEGQRSISFSTLDLIFVGEKKEQKDLAQLYREAILRLPALLTTKTDEYVFGAQAFRDWADDIENGKYDDPALLRDEESGESRAWWSYTNYVCALATNGSCCFSFLEKAMELNPDMAWLNEVSALYKKMGNMWLKDRRCLEKLDGGFNIKYETLQKPRKRAKIAAKIREFAACVDEVLAVLDRNTPEGYQPKAVPEIMKLANKINTNGGIVMQPVIKSAPATIKAKARNTVRVVEFSPCKMVWSGISKREDDWAEGGLLWRFSKWFSARNSLLAVRDLLWYDTEQGGFAWGWAVDTIPGDTDGFPILDFPGGLYATIVSVDGDEKDHDRQRSSLLKWIENSGCFVLDIGAGRYEAGHILVGTPQLKNAMGYHQMELYAPIRLKEGSAK